MRRATRKIKLDSNHKSLCDEVRGMGPEVVEIMEPVDTVMRLGSFVGFVELKPEGRGTYTRKQLKWMSETRMPVAIARNASEAIRFLRTGIGLSSLQKDLLAGFLVRTSAEKWNSEQIERILKI